MGDKMFPPLVGKTGLGGGGCCGGGGSISNSSAMFLQPEILQFAPELPDVFDVMSVGVSRLDIADMICRTSLDDVERLPAIHPSVMSSRGEQVTRYISFVSSPPIETRAPRDRPRYDKKKTILGPDDCFRCQLKTDHSACERHKFVRVGGGFRHSFSYIKQILDVIEDKSRLQATETAKRLAKVREEQEHKAFLRATQQKRKVKTYVRTKSGKLIKQYVYVTEKEYQEMKDDDVAARRILGLSADEKLEDFTSSRKKYVVNEDGEYMEVHKIRDDSAYQESLESVKRGQLAGKVGRRRRRRGGKGGDYSDDDSVESGVGGSAEGGGRRRRRRRHRRGGRSSSSVSEESYVSAGGTKHVKKSRRRRHRSRDGDGRRRRRRNRSYSSSYDSGSDDAGGDGKTRRRRRRGKHGRRRRRSYSSDDSDGDDSRGGKRRHRRRKRGSYSDTSGSDDSRRGHRKRRGRRRRSGSQGSASGSDRTEGGTRRRRHRRRHSDDSDSYSDGSSYDSTTGSRRRRKHRKHRADGDEQDGHGSYCSGSVSEGGEEGGRRHRHRRQRDSSRSSEYSASSNEDGVNEQAGGSKKKRRGRRAKHSDDGSEGSESYCSEGGEIDGDGKKKKRHRRHRKHKDDSSADCSSDTDDSEDSIDSKGERKTRRKKGRRKGKRGDESDGSGTSDDSANSHGKDGKRRRHKKGRRRRNGIGGGSSSLSSDSLSVTRDKPKSKALHSDSSKMLRSHGSGGYDSDSSSDSSSNGSMYSTSSSSAVSSASNVSSVDSSDISSIEGDYTKEELHRLKQAKKERKKKEKQQAKQEMKEDTRKKVREDKRESKRTDREEKVKDKKKRKAEKKKQRRKNKGRMSPVSSASDVSSVNSDDISDVDSNLGEEQKRIIIAEKKAKKKEAKKAEKFEEKSVKKKEEWKAKKKEKEKRRRVIELQKELERMSSASSIESVNSDDISSVDSDLSDGEKQRVKEKKKKKLKAERQLSKNILKAKIRLKENRKKEGRASDSDNDVDIDEMGDDEIKKAIKKLKDGKKKKRGKGGNGNDSDSSDDFGFGGKNKSSKNKKKTEKVPKSEMLELRAPDGTRIRVNIPKSMRVAGKFVGKIRLKMDGTVAADDDEDAESVIIDEDGNLVSQPTLLINHKTIILDNETWNGFQPTPPPPKTPTDGGRVKFSGIKKVLHAFRKNGEVLQKHLDEVLTTADELNDYKQRGDKRAMFIDERDSSIDYISHFRLVEKRKLDPFGKAFVVEDDDFNCVINLNELKGAIEGIPTLQTLKPKQLEYALKVLNIDEHSMITFKMFAVMAALGERMCTMDPISQHLIDISDLMDIQRKMELYKAMFYCNVNSERSDNHITSESLHIELRAGGLNRAQEQYVMKLMKPDEYSDISFIDYMAYIPLFLSMHENIIDNPLDMDEKYNQKNDSTQQRDMNPLGLPLRREFMEANAKTAPSKSIRTFIEKGDLVVRRELSNQSSLPRIPSSKKGSSKLSQR